MSAELRLRAAAQPALNLALIQVRDVHNALVWEIYVAGDDATIRLWSPAGGLTRTPLILTTGVELPADGRTARRIEVSASAGDDVVVRVDGRARIRLPALAPASTGLQRHLRVGVVAYAGNTATERIRASYRAIRVEDEPTEATNRGS